MFKWISWGRRGADLKGKTSRCAGRAPGKPARGARTQREEQVNPGHAFVWPRKEATRPGSLQAFPVSSPDLQASPWSPQGHHAAPSARRPISAPPWGPFPHKMRAPTGRGRRRSGTGCGRHPGGGSCLLLPASRAVGRCGSSPTSRTVPQDKDKSCCPFFPPASSLLFLAFTGRGNGGGKATARNEACRILPSAPDRASL